MSLFYICTLGFSLSFALVLLHSTLLSLLEFYLILISTEPIEFPLVRFSGTVVIFCPLYTLSVAALDPLGVILCLVSSYEEFNEPDLEVGL